jgi:hypothetical protein
MRRVLGTYYETPVFHVADDSSSMFFSPVKSLPTHAYPHLHVPPPRQSHAANRSLPGMSTPPCPARSPLPPRSKSTILDPRLISSPGTAPWNLRTRGLLHRHRGPSMIHPLQVGLAEAQQIKVTRTPTVLMHTHSGKGPMSLKD